MIYATAPIRAREGTGRRVPIVAMTAGAMQEDKDRAFASGMDDYLARPVKKADVLAKVAYWSGWCRRRRSRGRAGLKATRSYCGCCRLGCNIK